MSTRCRCRCRRRNVTVNERVALQYVKAGGVVENTSNVVTVKELYPSDSLALLEGNEKAATHPCEVGRRISEYRGISGKGLLARLEERVPALGAQRPLRDKREAFRSRLERTGPIEDIKSNVAKAVDCVDPTAVLVGHQNLTAEGPEA